MLGPGTGLGEAQLFWDEIQGGYKVWPSEGSHSGFAPRGWKQRALQARLLVLAGPDCEQRPFPAALHKSWGAAMRGCAVVSGKGSPV